jgi:starvation-inducible DNA-binding protein
MHKTKNDIPAKLRNSMVKLLNERLADLIDLSLQTKQAHWNVKGPSFIALHKLFDEAAGMFGEFVDEVAERITSLGGTAEGTLPAVTKRTSLAAYPLTISAGSDHVDALSSAIAAVAKLTRLSIDEADEAGDAVTADLFTRIAGDIDKMLWFVEAHMQSDS